MKNKKSCRSLKYRWLTGLLMVVLLALAFLPGLAIAEKPELIINPPIKEVRDDGLTVIMREPSNQSNQELQYMTMVLKTGYGHDPDGQYGITGLTNELIYFLLNFSNALMVDYNTYSEFSVFNFVTTKTDFKIFCYQLDQTIRSDALLLYDLTNEMIQYRLNMPKPPESKAEADFISMLYGPSHPYVSFFKPDYSKIEINAINKWFRQIYRPNNLIISSSMKLPEDFLRRPAGRDLKEQITLSKIQAAEDAAGPTLNFTPIHDDITTIYLGFQAPKFGEEGVYATYLIQRYLDKKLRQLVREDNGLCYELSVYYPVRSKPTAPNLEITLHTLAADSGTAINLIIAEFKKLASEGISKEELNKLLIQERKLWLLKEKELGTAIFDAGLYGYLDQKSLIDKEEYLTRFEEESKIVPKIMANGLSRLKIAIAGPEDTKQYLSEIKLKVDFPDKK